MELDEQAFLEEILSLRRDAAWDCNAMSDFFSPAAAVCTAAMDCSFQDRHQPPPTVSVLPTFTASYDQPQPHPHPAAPGFDCLSEVYGAAAAFGGPNAADYGAEMGFLDVIEPKAALVEAGGLGVCKVEPGLAEGAAAALPAPPASRKKRVEGMPSKNLMAERRRRKRLNDRLSMLRSVVPKISKMDRTSILGDTIDYMKELLERIKLLQEEIDEQQQETPGVLSVFRELNPNEMVARNTPKFDVERKEGGARPLLRRRAMASPSPSSSLHPHQHPLPPTAHPQFQAPPPSMPPPPAAPPKAFDLEVTVVSGKHLKNVNWRRGDLRAYVVAYLDPSRRAATRPDDVGGCKPAWNERLVLPLPPHLSPHDPSILLSLDVFHSKPSDSPKPLVGSARSPLRDLLFPTNPNPSHDSSASPLVSLPLLRPSGRPQGKLRIRVAIRERSPPPPEPQYPPPSSSPYYFPPPPPPAYSAPPQYGSEQYYRPSGYYSAPAPPPQYEYTGGPSAPVDYSRQYEQRGRTGAGDSGSGRYGVGTGLAVGAVAGALGGLAIGEGVKYKEEKAAERVEEKVVPAARDDYSEYRGDY